MGILEVFSENGKDNKYNVVVLHMNNKFVFLGFHKRCSVFYFLFSKKFVPPLVSHLTTCYV